MAAGRSNSWSSSDTISGATRASSVLLSASMAANARKKLSEAAIFDSGSIDSAAPMTSECLDGVEADVFVRIVRAR